MKTLVLLAALLLAPSLSWAACEVQTAASGYANGAVLSGDVCGAVGERKVGLATKSSGEDQTNDVVKVESQFEYEPVAASQTDQVMGATGAVGDLLHALVCVVSTAATAATSIKDGAGSSIAVFPNSPGGGIGTYTIVLDMQSTAGAWSVTTGAGVACIGIGRFS